MAEVLLWGFSITGLLVGILLIRVAELRYHQKDLECLKSTLLLKKRGKALNIDLRYDDWEEQAVFIRDGKQLTKESGSISCQTYQYMEICLKSMSDIRMARYVLDDKECVN